MEGRESRAQVWMRPCALKTCMVVTSDMLAGRAQFVHTHTHTHTHTHLQAEQACQRFVPMDYLVELIQGAVCVGTVHARTCMRVLTRAHVHACVRTRIPSRVYVPF